MTSPRQRLLVAAATLGLCITFAAAAPAAAAPPSVADAVQGVVHVEPVRR